MPYVVTRFESTPNPNAVKCWLDKPVSDRPRSFLTPASAVGDPVAEPLFVQTGATSVLLNGDWITVNKPPEATWSVVKRAISRALQSVQ